MTNNFASNAKALTIEPFIDLNCWYLAWMVHHWLNSSKWLLGCFCCHFRLYCSFSDVCTIALVVYAITLHLAVKYSIEHFDCLLLTIVKLEYAIDFSKHLAGIDPMDAQAMRWPFESLEIIWPQLGRGSFHTLWTCCLFVHSF